MTRFSRAQNIRFGLVAMIVSLLLVESVARLGYTVYSDVSALRKKQRSEWFVHTPELGWQLRPGFRGQVAGAWRHFDERGFVSVDSDQVSGDTTRKVLFLGDSDTFGWGVPTEATFVEVVDEALRGVSAIGLGVPGYTSFQGYRALEQRIGEILRGPGG